MNLATCDSMLKKIEMPTFDGTRTYEWIADVDHFFTVGPYKNHVKMNLVPLCLQGQVKKWFAWVKKHGGFRDWEDFKRRMIVRFIQLKINLPQVYLRSNRQAQLQIICQSLKIYHHKVLV